MKIELLLAHLSMVVILELAHVLVQGTVKPGQIVGVKGNALHIHLGITDTLAIKKRVTGTVSHGIPLGLSPW